MILKLRCGMLEKMLLIDDERDQVKESSFFIGMSAGKTFPRQVSKHQHI